MILSDLYKEIRSFITEIVSCMDRGIVQTKGRHNLIILPKMITYDVNTNMYLKRFRFSLNNNGDTKSTYEPPMTLSKLHLELFLSSVISI